MLPLNVCVCVYVCIHSLNDWFNIISGLQSIWFSWWHSHRPLGVGIANVYIGNKKQHTQLERNTQRLIIFIRIPNWPSQVCNYHLHCYHLPFGSVFIHLNHSLELQSNLISNNRNSWVSQQPNRNQFTVSKGKVQIVFSLVNYISSCEFTRAQLSSSHYFCLRPFLYFLILGWCIGAYNLPLRQ